MAGPSFLLYEADVSELEPDTAWRTTTSTNHNPSARQHFTTTSLRLEQQSALLSLPAELRNTIYELTVIDESGDIRIQQTLREPALLSVCSQIRDEASAIYYKQNRFLYNAGSAGADILNKCSTKTAAAAFIDLDVYVFLPENSGSIAWPQFVAWCRDVNRNAGARTVTAAEGMDETQRFICNMLAKSRDDGGHFAQWIDVKENLEARGLMMSGPGCPVHIEWEHYTFVDGFDYEGNDCPEKACSHDEEERAEAGCKYCSLTPWSRQSQRNSGIDDCMESGGGWMQACPWRALGTGFENMSDVDLSDSEC